MLEVLLSTDSSAKASNQLTSMLTLSDEDRRLAAEIRETRERLAVRQQTLRDGRVTLTALRDAEKERTQALAVQQRQVDAAGRRCAPINAGWRSCGRSRRRSTAESAHNEQRTKVLIDEERDELAGQRELVTRLSGRRTAWTWPIGADSPGPRRVTST